MDGIATMPAVDRLDVFCEAAARRGRLNGPIIEKDFWVCWTLKRIFGLPDSPTRVLFKGGTSLSKVFGVIERFSEDVDLSLFREDLGYDGEQDPATAPSKKKAKRLVKQLDGSCRDAIEHHLLPSLMHDFSGVLGEPEKGWNLAIDPEDPMTVNFAYPSGVGGDLLAEFPYVTPMIRLEMGARSEHWPSEVSSIRPYVADDFPDLFRNPDVTVHVLGAERTFWDKILVLHAEYHRPQGRRRQERISRHYYDVARLYRSEIGSRALAEPELLESVVTHQQLYFPRPWACYEEAVPGTVRVLPISERLMELERDYRAMSDYFFGEAPDFYQILDVLRELEDRVNRL